MSVGQGLTVLALVLLFAVMAYIADKWEGIK
jgi:hypothetical protein